MSLEVEERRETGRYYTPAPLATHLAQATVAPATGIRPLAILDPACGSGALLVAALEVLAARVPPALRGSAASMLHGVDLDAQALATARAALTARARALGLGGTPVLVRGDALDALARAPRFDVVIANPPWGQKAMVAERQRRRELVARYPSARGIFDWFRPFVELGAALLRPGGRFGMVLPDIVLLKDYEPTRRFLLDHLALDAIEHWGRAFADATIDAVTIVGERRTAPADQTVSIRVHDPHEPLAHALPQADFARNRRATFNLHLTAARRRELDALAGHPRLGDRFEVHEGVHSGNCRAALFVHDAVDASCRPLLVRGNEVTADGIRWGGRYLRLSALPRRGGSAYANLGRPEWHERPKLLVRRTGDRIIAALDREGRYASNNFFLVLPRGDGDLDALCTLLNSPFATWWFRTVEPRQGRAFAELKIKHLVDLPLDPSRCHSE